MRMSSNQTEMHQISSVGHKMSRKKLATFLLNNKSPFNTAGQRTPFLPSPDLNLEMEGKHYASSGHETGA
jgi:hypothetical protein